MTGVLEVSSVRQTAELCALMGGQLVLVGLPAAAGGVAALRLGVRGRVALLMAAFSTAGLSGYLALWIYLLSPVAGQVYAVVLVPATIAVLVVAAWGLTREAWTMLGGLAIPAALMAFATILVTALGLMYGGWADPLQAAANRFSHTLPADNGVPLMFAQALTSSHRPIPSPLFGDWLSSDRPPLQAGMFLAAAPLRSQLRPGTYEVTGVILQSIWILPLWAFLAESKIRLSPLASESRFWPASRY